MSGFSDYGASQCGNPRGIVGSIVTWAMNRLIYRKDQYPQKSAAILKNHLPQMDEKILDRMGHGQFLHEHPAEYANG